MSQSSSQHRPDGGSQSPASSAGVSKRPSKLKRVLIGVAAVVVAAALALAFVNWYPVAATRGDVYTIAQMQERDIHTDAILVLGAAVLPDGEPSDILADRLEVAADLYEAGVAPVVIVSGDHREDDYDEPAAMKRYCEQLGVPGDAIYMDGGGYDTFASVWRAKNVYGAKSITITTQAYHLYRAMAIAQGLDMQVYGVPSDKGAYDNQAAYSMREAIARLKDMLQTHLGIPPEGAYAPMTR